MPPSRRLADLEEILELRYENLRKVEKRLAMTDDIFTKSAIEQRIREEVLPEIHKYEDQYWQLLAQESLFCEVEEVDAGKAIVEVMQEVEWIESNPNTNYPDELMQKLQEILDKLKEPGQLASAKAKLALNFIPGVLWYEVELDTESALRRAFQPIKRLFKGAMEAEKKK